jgi:hypothetical protein
MTEKKIPAPRKIEHQKTLCTFDLFDFMTSNDPNAPSFIPEKIEIQAYLHGAFSQIWTIETDPFCAGKDYKPLFKVVLNGHFDQEKDSEVEP